MWAINLAFNVRDDELDTFSAPFRESLGEELWRQMIGDAMTRAIHSLRIPPALNGEMMDLQPAQLWPRFRTEFKLLCLARGTVFIEADPTIVAGPAAAGLMTLEKLQPRRAVRVVDHTTGTGAAVAHHDDRARRAGTA